MFELSLVGLVLTFCLQSIAASCGCSLPSPSPPPSLMEPVRCSAKVRRLRQKRSDARMRLRLAADAVLLGEHHASAVPQMAASSAMRGDKVVDLLEQLVAQQCALFTFFASMSAWQAGSLSPSGFSADCGVCGG